MKNRGLFKVLSMLSMLFLICFAFMPDIRAQEHRQEKYVYGTKANGKVQVLDSKGRLQYKYPSEVAQIKSETYAAVTTMLEDSTLSPGANYVISNYRTKHIIPGTTDTFTGPTERLIVTAISTAELAPVAYSIDYPDDIIYYNPESDQTYMPGCDRGYIYRRIDTKQNNDIGFDFRNVNYRRYRLNVSNWLVGTTYEVGATVKRATGTTNQQKEIYISLVGSNTGNAVTSTAHWRRFEWDNETYAGVDSTQWYLGSDENLYSVTTSDTLYIDTTLFVNYDSTVINNQIEAKWDCNTVFFGNGVYSNNIGAVFSRNSIGVSFYNNNIRHGFSNNSIGNSFSENEIGYHFTYNSIAANFALNLVGSGFASNFIGTGFTQNVVGYGFSINMVMNSVSVNTFGPGFYGNSVNSTLRRTTVESAVGGIIFQTSTPLTTLQNDYSKRIIETPDGPVLIYISTDTGTTAYYNLSE